MNRRQKIIVSITGIFIVMLALVGLTYAYFLTRITGNENEKSISVVTGELDLEFDDGTNIVRASALVPIQREQILTHAAKKQFKIKNTGTLKAFVDITLDDIDLSPQLKRFDFLYALYEVVDGVEKNLSNGSFEYVEDSVDVINYQTFEVPVVSGETTTYDEKTYNLYVWIEETNMDQSSMMGQDFSASITVTGRPYWESPESDFTINESGDIIAYTGEGGNVIIPTTINGIEVTSIGLSGDTIKDRAIFVGKGLTNVVIPNTVTHIGDFAFISSGLSNIVIPNSVTSIGGLSGNKLKKLSIPNSVTSISFGAFSDNQLTNVVIPNSITSISEGAFSNNQLTSIIIPNSVITIIGESFNANQISNLVIGNSVTSIGLGAFRTNQLTSVVIPNNVTTLGNYVFNVNPNLTSIEVKRPSADGMTLGENWYGSCPTENIYFTS